MQAEIHPTGPPITHSGALFGTPSVFPRPAGPSVAPIAPAPALLQNDTAVSIRKAGECGRGLFVDYDIPRQHMVLLERPAFTTISDTYKCNQANFETIERAWVKLSQDKKLELRRCFHNRLQSISLEVPLPLADKKRLESFIADYGFRDLSDNNRNAYIFKLASHLNHACGRCANCRFWVNSISPNEIHVKLTKDVSAGNQLFITYNERDPFKCPVCQRSGFRRVIAAVKRASRAAASRAATSVRRRHGTHVAV